MTVGRDYPLHPPRAGCHQAGDPCPLGCTDTGGLAQVITALSGNPADSGEFVQLWCPRCRTSYGQE